MKKSRTLSCLSFLFVPVPVCMPVPGSLRFVGSRYSVQGRGRLAGLLSGNGGEVIPNR
jgi:hypothetical protein